MTLVKLTRSFDGKPVYVNPERVEYITECKCGGSSVWTSCCTDKPFIVNENPSQIADMIADIIRIIA